MGAFSTLLEATGLSDPTGPRRLAALRQRVPLSPATEALHHYLSTPLPSRSTPVDDLRLLAIDMETTGLDPNQHDWLSVGFVPVDPIPADGSSTSRGHEIALAGAGSAVVATSSEVGESATVHGLTDDRVADGRPLTEVVDLVLRALAGRVLLAHFTQIEVGQLRRAVQRLHGITLPLVTLDTLELQFRIWGAEEGRIPEGALRLWTARQQYGLPDYPAHDASADALACAELFLAHMQDEHLPRGVGRLCDLQ